VARTAGSWKASLSSASLAPTHQTPSRGSASRTFLSVIGASSLPNPLNMGQPRSRLNGRIVVSCDAIADVAHAAISAKGHGTWKYISERPATGGFGARRYLYHWLVVYHRRMRIGWGCCFRSPLGFFNCLVVWLVWRWVGKEKMSTQHETPGYPPNGPRDSTGV
jgi:hypothetical protein